MQTENAYAVQLRGITKTFGPVTANKNVDLDIRRGEILALLGENGSGKTTLMNVLSGIYFPDAGRIYIGGQEAAIHTPRDAFDYGIGMIHQHFKLVDVFTAAENIILGLDEPGRLNLKAASEKIRAICGKYGFDVNPEQKVYDMSVSQKQTVEIVKVLYRGAEILILDEPTAVLTPQETEKLFAVLRNMKADGKAIVIITHKLHEVMDISDRVAVLRKGEFVGETRTAETSPQALTDQMVGRAVTLNIDRPLVEERRLRLDVQHLTVFSGEGVRVLDDVSFPVYSGEILGIAGISGSGQKELLEAIAGLQKVQPGGRVLFYPPEEESEGTPESGPEGEDLIGKDPLQIHKLGISMAFVPEDRLGMGLVADMDMVGNMMLKSYREGPGPLVDFKQPKDLASAVKKRLKVSTPGITTPVRRLSGGNVQKVLVGREIASRPAVLMTAYAVRGLDINTSYTIYGLLNQQKQNGVAVIYVGEDLDVLLELCDRILVLCAGKINGIVDGRAATKEEVGLLMTNLRADRKEEEA